MIQRIIRTVFGSRRPLLNKDFYDSLRAREGETGKKMSAAGSVGKTLFLALIALTAAVLSFQFAEPTILRWVGLIGAIIMILALKKYPDKGMFFGPTYAVFKGIFAGTISFNIANATGSKDIIIQAFLLSISILIGMLILHSTRLVPITRKFRTGVAIATMGIMGYYLISTIIRLLGIKIPYIHDGGAVSIGISAVILIVVSMRLLINFANFNKGIKLKAPKVMEWYFATGLLFSLIWLYIESLKMLKNIFKTNKAKNRGNRGNQANNRENRAKNRGNKAKNRRNQG